MNNRQQKIALVSGGSRGIGRAIVEELAQDHLVIFTYVSRPDAAEEVVRGIEQKGGQAIAYKADITDQAELVKLSETIQNDYGYLSVLVNNAGITRDTLLMRMPLQDWQAVLNTNLLGPVQLTELTEKLLLASPERAQIINISSIVGVYGNAGQLNYACAKGALIGYTKWLAKQLLPKVQVNSIAPGLIETDMTASFDLGKVTNDKKVTNENYVQVQVNQAANMTGQGAGHPTDIAQGVRFLVQNGSYVTGQVLEIDGGLSLFDNIDKLL